MSVMKGCNCVFKDATTEQEAMDEYKRLFEKCKKAYGSSWVYTYAKPFFYGSDSSKIVTFLLKSHKGSNEHIPTVRLRLDPDKNGKYTTSIYIEDTSGE